MPQSTSADELYRNLLQMHGDAFQAGRYELGYHLLAAAFHAADELEHVDLLTEVGALAETRQREVDAITPEHRLSTASAQRRGIQPLYRVLAAIVASAKGRIAAERIRDRNHQKAFRGNRLGRG